MAEKTETKTENLEREYIIPLRKKWAKVPRYKRANKAIKAIKEFLARHMKIRDRDLRKIKIDKYLNETVWFRGIRNPPSKIKVKAIKEHGTGEVRAELSEMPEKIKFKKARLEKRDQKAAQTPAKKPAEKPEEKLEEQEQIQEEKKEEEKEKKAAVIEAGKEMEKAAAKQMKKMKSQKIKQPKRQQRKALAK